MDCKLTNYKLLGLNLLNVITDCKLCECRKPASENKQENTLYRTKLGRESGFDYLCISIPQEGTQRAISCN